MKLDYVDYPFGTPERERENQKLYAFWLDPIIAPDEAKQAFLRAMKGREFGYGPLTNAFAWFLNGWSCSKNQSTPLQPRMAEQLRICVEGRVEDCTAWNRETRALLNEFDAAEAAR